MKKKQQTRLRPVERKETTNAKQRGYFACITNKASSARKTEEEQDKIKKQLKTNKTTTKTKNIQLAQTDPRREKMLI